MTLRRVGLAGILAIALALVWGCGGAEESPSETAGGMEEMAGEMEESAGEMEESAAAEAPAPGETAASPEAAFHGGQYDVTGVTVSQEDGSSRPIYGRVVLVVEGDRYTTHFELSTLFPDSEAAAARVVGTGEGSVEGNVLEGDAKAHLVLAAAPGVDVGFAYIPAEFGAHIVSRTRAELLEDDTVRMEIENRPAEGEDYTPTHTSLVGYRLGEP